MQIGALTAFLTYLMQILMSVMMATFMFMMVPRAEVCAERIQEVLDTESSVVPPAEPVRELRAARSAGAARRRTSATPAPRSRCCRCRRWWPGPGETTAIIGSTGSGQDDAARPGPAAVRRDRRRGAVDGVDVRELDPELLAGRSAWCRRSRTCSPGRSRPTCGTASPDATDEELWHALEVAQAKRLRRGDGGRAGRADRPGRHNVSGGQRQRLAIARTLVRGPEIYLFDDSFSALDYATDAALRAALAPETAEATVVIVAQRVSTIRDADRIIVLDEGRVVGTGTHHELMDDNETYREIVLSQLTEAEAA